jgi:hypothetical protein
MDIAAVGQHVALAGLLLANCAADDAPTIPASGQMRVVLGILLVKK